MEIEEFKVRVALDYRRELYTEICVGLMGIFILSTIIFIGYPIIMDNILLIFGLVVSGIMCGYFVVRALKLIIYLNKKYNLPIIKIFNFNFKKDG